MKKNSIALIGFMATGKTTIGKLLAKKLGKEYRFIEMDVLIEEKAGKPIYEIFSQKGESEFRKLENETCKILSDQKKVIISCGGGTILNKDNVKILQNNCLLVLLELRIETLSKRILKNGIRKRPLVDKNNPKNEIVKLYFSRKPKYHSVADIIIDANDKEEEEIVDEIMTKFINQ